MAGSFTFINTTDAPSLSVSGVKRMRAHVTKTNFAQRRRRMAKERVHDDERLQEQGQGNVGFFEVSRIKQLQPTLGPANAGSILDRVVLYTAPTNPHLSVKFLIDEFRPVIFPAAKMSPGSFDEATWTQLVVSEPALLEASMSVGVRYCPG
ncbi:hypothetical protein G7046_g3090 [Stylonectria norvegica]|nr:hypothetical protein G7046_g3090 [Stylonectria norvegica]